MPMAKRPRSPSPELASAGPSSPHKAKKLKLLASHTLASPFPEFTRPTPAEAAEVHAVLEKAHPALAGERKDPAVANDSAGTCGSVPDVLESLIGTILSQNTTSHNSTAAKRSLDATFGRNDFAAIARAPSKDVVEAIKMGGLANKKAAVIQNILREVNERHGVYSLQHLAGPPDVDGKGKEKSGGLAVSDEEAMQELVSYKGVGPKTASLSKLLGWVPTKADRVTAQAHLDLKIPDEFKYGLHVLMVGHGRRCKGCKGGNGGNGECVLKKWLKEHKNVKEESLDTRIVKAEEDISPEQ